MKMNYIRVIVLAVGFFLGASECFLKAQVVDQHPKFNKRVGLGVFDHQEGRLITGSFEFRLLPRLALEPSIGFTVTGPDRRAPLPPPRREIYYKYAASIQMKYFFLFNRRHPLEGIYATLLGSYYRSHAITTAGDYVFYRSYHSRIGIGFGGNYYFYKRFSVGGAFWLGYTSGTVTPLNPDGSVLYFYHRSGFVLPYTLQVGFTF